MVFSNIPILRAICANVGGQAPARPWAQVRTTFPQQVGRRAWSARPQGEEASMAKEREYASTPPKWGLVLLRRGISGPVP